MYLLDSISDISQRCYRGEYPVDKVFVIIPACLCAIIAVGIFSLLIGVYSYAVFPVIACLVVLIIIAMFCVFRAKVGVMLIDKVAFAISLFFALFNALFHHVTLWGGFDSGVYSCFAINIARTGSLFIHHNGYPYVGFVPVKEGTCTSFFLPGYSYLLSLFHKVGGLGFMFWANAFLLFFVLIILYAVGSLIANRKVGMIFILLYSLHYTTLWFSRRTLAECIMVPLIWLSFLLFVYGVKKRNGNYIAASFIPLTLGLMMRFEVLFYAFVFAVVTFFLYFYDKICKKEAIRLTRVSILSLTVVLLNVVNLDLYLYLTEPKCFFNYLNETWLKVQLLFGGHSPMGTVSIGNSTYKDYVLKYVFNCFTAYLLIPLLVLIFFGIKHRRYKSGYLLLLVLCSPAFLLVPYPTISWVQPWFMRHYWVVLVPLIILTASIGLDAIKSRIFEFLCIFLIIALFVVYWAPVITFAEERGFPDSLEKIHSFLGETEESIIIGLKDHKISEPLHFIYGYRTISSNYLDLDKKKVFAELEDERKVYVISRYRNSSGKNHYEILPHFELFPDERLQLIGLVDRKTKVLQRVAEADRYVEPHLRPLKVLYEGYKPIADTFNTIPPNGIIVSDYLLYIYLVE